MKRSASLTNLVHDVSGSLADYARWPETDARRIAVEHDIAALRTALRGYDPVVPRSILLTLVADTLEHMFIREASVPGIRLAFDKMIDIFDRSKD